MCHASCVTLYGWTMEFALDATFKTWITLLIILAMLNFVLEEFIYLFLLSIDRHGRQDPHRQKAHQQIQVRTYPPISSSFALC